MGKLNSATTQIYLVAGRVMRGCTFPIPYLLTKQVLEPASHRLLSTPVRSVSYVVPA